MSQQKVTLKSMPSISFWLFGLIALALAIGAISYTVDRMPKAAFRSINPVMQPPAAAQPAAIPVAPAKSFEHSVYAGYGYELQYGSGGIAVTRNNQPFNSNGSATDNSGVASVLSPSAAIALPNSLYLGYGYVLKYGPEGSALITTKASEPAVEANTAKLETFDPETNSILLPGNRVVHPSIVSSKTVDLGAGYVLKTGPLGGVIIAPEALAPTSAFGKRMDIGGGYWLEYNANGDARLVAPQSPVAVRTTSGQAKKMDIGAGYWLEYNANGDASIVAPNTPVSARPADAPKVKRVDVGGGYWLETNLTSGETWLAAPQTTFTAAWPKRIYIGGGFWLVTDPITGETTISMQ